MLRNKPIFTYNGLTVVLSSPSRFDKEMIVNGQSKGKLLSATGGVFFNSCLNPDFNQYQCDVRVKEDTSDLLPGTKAILLLGEDAAKKWLNNTTNTLGEIRGSLYERNGIPVLASYFPQDCADVKNHEREHNPHRLNESVGSDSEKESDEKRRHGKTSWSNYGFWLDRDIAKVKYILKNGRPVKAFEPEYILYPNLSRVIKDWTETKNRCFYFDIETDANLNILCLSYSFDLDKIFVVPFISHQYESAYSDMANLFKALAICLRDNISVAHNGAGFDFFVLAHKYHIPVGQRLYDTMVAQSRIYPDTEKSLGHCTSLWTWEVFHKDEGSGGYATQAQAEAMWRYCGKDVFTMQLIHAAQIEHAKRVPGMLDSIQQANDSIRPYLITTLTGFQYDKKLLDKIVDDNDKLLEQYLRVLNVLVGADNLKKIRGGGTSSIINSNKQCCKYFHEMLGYEQVGYGKTLKDGTKNPSLAKTNMFKLKQKYNNPVIDVILTAREVIKESSSLAFTPWKEGTPV